jgi:pyochelin biosynthetic protein PchC
MTVSATTQSPGASARWVRRPRPIADPQARLLYLPPAGCAASICFGWAARLPERIELLCAQYPGRQDRLGEPCLTTIAELADGVAAALARYADRPLHLFGHSMGALVAYETAARLQAGPGPGPAGLFVSGSYAPHRATPLAEELTDAELESLFYGFTWLEPEALELPELREIVLPALMTDIRAVLAYRLAHPVRLDCPVFVYGGTEDVTATPEELSAWSAVSSGAGGWRLFDGDHFYIRAHEPELVADIVSRMSDCA